MLLHRKNDNLDASSKSLIRYGVSGGTFAGSRSTGNRNSGLTKSRFTARSIPTLKFPWPRPSAYMASIGLRSASVTGRRNARRARVETIVFAQSDSCDVDAGWQTKIRRRLGESPGPLGANGP